MAFDERAARKAPTELHSTSPRRRALRWLIPIVSAVALLALVAVVIARSALPTPQASIKPTTTPAASPLALDPAAYGMECVKNAAWSPDGARIAILGTLQGCGQTDPENYYPSVVEIVSAKDGQALKAFQPDTTTLHQFHVAVPHDGAPIAGPDATDPAGALIQPGIMYTDLGWSPDGASIALPFDFAYLAKPSTGGSSAAQRVSVSGVYVGAVEGTGGDAGAVAFGVTLSQQLLYVAEWNVKTGKPVMTPAWQGPPLQGGTVAQLEPVSLNYSWRPDGSLAGSDAVKTTYPPAPAPLGPVGNPDGGTSFTVWQGMDIRVVVGDPQHPEPAATFMAESHFLAWSPDGTYLLNASYYSWRVQPSKQTIPSPSQLQREGGTGLPLLPIRDAAMDAMLSPEPGAHPYTFASDRFTWSPDGRLLAAIADGGGLGGHTIGADVTVLIVDCASGKTLATLQANGASAAWGGLGSLQWSPDGKKLLVGAGSEYFVFGPGQLPQE